MFQLAELRHMVRIPPWCFGQSLNDAVIQELNKKLANKVVLNVGLCIVLFDLTSVGDSYIFPGDGASHTKVTFRYLVFRPFVEEIIEGAVKASNAEGIQVSLGFFEDIYIRSDNMMTSSHYDETEKLWVWDYETDGETHHLFIDIGETIRFKVVAEQFTDTTPSGPEASETESGTMERKEGKIPYLIYGAINDQGLGLVSWWNASEGGEEEEEEEDEVEEEEDLEEEAP